MSTVTDKKVIDPFKVRRFSSHTVLPLEPTQPYVDLKLEQGTPEWHRARMRHVTASDVAAIMGVSVYKNRNEILGEKLSGKEAAVSDFKRRLFELGHLAEDAARRWANLNLGFEFNPCVLESSAHPYLLASLDGFDSNKKIILEAKYLGASALKDVMQRKLKSHHNVQIQTQLLISGAKKCMYFAMDPNGNAEVIPVYPDLKLMKEIIEETSKFYREWQEKKNESDTSL